MRKKLLFKILPDSLFKKIIDKANRYNLRCKVKQPLDIESKDTIGVLIYEDLLSFYKQLETSYDLSLTNVVTGSIKKEEASLLYSLIIKEKPKTILQVGTFVGFSTLIIAEALRRNETGKIYTVDPEILHLEIYNPVDIAKIAVEKRGLADRVEFIKGWFSNVPHWYNKITDIEVVGPALIKNIGILDFVFVAGDHSVMSTISDFASVVNSLKINGICAIHDVCCFSSVCNAVSAILSDKFMERMFTFSILESHNGLALFRKVQEYVSIVIYIKDIITKKPVSDVVLYNKKYEQKFISNLKGEIHIPKILADRYYIDVIAKGYKSLNNHNVSLNSQPRFQEFFIELEPE